jgi:hypothetical protein
VVLSMPQVFSPDTRKLGDFYPALFGLMISLRFIALVGVWYMKRWGAELFIAVFAMQIIFALLINSYELNKIALTLNVMLLADFIGYYKRMDNNL